LESELRCPLLDAVQALLIAHGDRGAGAAAPIGLDVLGHYELRRRTPNAVSASARASNCSDSSGLPQAETAEGANPAGAARRTVLRFAVMRVFRGLSWSVRVRFLLGVSAILGFSLDGLSSGR
jgi:hypothetical protein